MIGCTIVYHNRIPLSTGNKLIFRRDVGNVCRQHIIMQEQTHLPAPDELAAAQPGVVAAPASAIAAAKRERLWIVLSLLALYLIWGSTYFGIRVAVQSIPPYLMAGVRFLTAGIILYAILRARGAAHPTLQQWRGSAIVGLFLGVGGMGSVAFAEQYRLDADHAQGRALEVGDMTPRDEPPVDLSNRPHARGRDAPKHSPPPPAAHWIRQQRPPAHLDQDGRASAIPQPHA